MVGAAHAEKHTEALAADHVIACIRTAVAAQPGLVKEVEAEYERGHWLCEVKLVDDASTERLGSAAGADPPPSNTWGTT